MHGAQSGAVPLAGGSARVQRELAWILLKNHCSVLLEIALLLASWSHSACLAPFLLLRRQQQRVRKTYLDTIYLPWTPTATSKHLFKHAHWLKNNAQLSCACSSQRQSAPSHHASESLFNPGPSDNRKRGRMKNLIFRNIHRGCLTSGYSSGNSVLSAQHPGSSRNLTCLLLAICKPPAPLRSSLSHLLRCWIPFLSKAVRTNTAQASLLPRDQGMSTHGAQGNGGQHELQEAACPQ